MMGLLFFGVIGLWIWFAIWLGRKIPQWLNLKYRGLVTAILMPVFLVAPFVDDWLGMRQFKQLCNERDMVFVSPDASIVKRATCDYGVDRKQLKNTWIPITSASTVCKDVDTKKTFISIDVLNTQGGFLYGKLGLGLGNSTQCMPSEADQTFKKLDIDTLIKNGEETK
jgi:hypothetical protein